MLRVNEFQLYELAIHIHPLTQVTTETKYSQIWYDWLQAKQALQNLFQVRALEVCYGPANELYHALRGFVPDSLEEAIAKLPPNSDEEQPLGYPVLTVKQSAEKFETVLSAELPNSDTYWISPKGTHKTSMLLQSAHLELPASVIAQMPDVKTDFDEAGRCLLFDNSTAAGFHLLRATETVLRKYYETVTGVQPKLKYRNWGAYIKVLQQSKADSKITNHLDHMRNNYRNPVLHPEVNLSSDEAQVLFGVCVSAIFLMVNEVKALTAKSASPLAFPGPMPPTP